MKYLDYGIEILEKIESLGYEAFIVGGAVRDYLLNIEFNDIDITTNMPAEEIKKHFITKDNGLDYLSITILYKDYDFEITHYRCDVSYKNHRHPEVKYVNTLFEDSLRRDFTINALAMNSKKEIIDYHGGQSDLKKKLIKMIGDPDVRFDEDALRILRAFYFSSKLGFEIEAETLISAINSKKLLESLSGERILEYIPRIINQNYTNGLDYIKEYNAFEFIPEYKDYLEVLKKDYRPEDYPLYYYLKYNKYPTLISKEQKRLCNVLNILIDSNFSNLELFKNKNDYYKLKEVLSNNNYDVNLIDNKIKELRLESLKDLAVSSKEIAELFIGEQIKLKLDEITSLILDGRLSNTRDAIMNYLRG